MKIIDFLRKLLEVLWSVPTRLFGSRNERLLKHYSGAVAQINALEPDIAKLSDAALAAKTGELKERYSKSATLEQLLPEAFAVVREASKRTLRMRHFDEQLVGCMVLHDGKIAEMKTGEGKTLVATLPAYLNALSGRGVHIVTVNDYLASRDADWMGKVYKFLGLSVGVILTQIPHAEKQSAYAADITYGTNNEFGFDYLRDNMAMQVGDRFQRKLNYAIVDEVDSILIDEARTPLIISGRAEDRTEIYQRMDKVAPMLKRQEKEGAPGDFYVDEKNHTVLLSEEGHESAEKLLGRAGLLPDGRSLYEPAYVNLMHHLNAALRAHNLFFRDRHYVVQEGDVVIVDEFTGRLMPGRRWSDGLHQAIEAKDKLPHQVLNAKQHAREAEIVAQAGRPKMVTIATNMAGRGTDIVLGGNVEKQIDVVRAAEDLDAAGKERRIAELREEWQGLHNRVIASGGLHIIGTERHEARRIDNQLRGRSGRQGDPGSSRFYLSLEDPLLRIFAGERVNAIMQRLGMPEGEPIEHSLVTRSIESAQRKVEAHNFDIRKQLLEYDNVANDQRREIYQLRNSILESQDVSERIAALREGVVTDFFRAHVPEESMEEQWDIPGLEKVYVAELRLELALSKWLASDPSLDDNALLKRAIDEAHAAYVRKMAANPPEAVHQFERLILLSTLDNHWLEHLAALDHLRQGIHLRGYAQKNPKQEYKREAFELFGNLVESVKLEVTRTLMTVELRNPEQVEQVERVAPAIENVQYQHAGYEEALAGEGADAAPVSKPAPFVRQMGKIGRNDPCPCGSGKKYKHCHGKLA